MPLAYLLAIRLICPEGLLFASPSIPATFISGILMLVIHRTRNTFLILEAKNRKVCNRCLEVFTSKE